MGSAPSGLEVARLRLNERAQTQHIIGGILKAEGGAYDDLVTVSVFLTEGGREAYNQGQRDAGLASSVRRDQRMVVVRELARPELKIEVNAVALLKQ